VEQRLHALPDLLEAQPICLHVHAVRIGDLAVTIAGRGEMTKEKDLGGGLRAVVEQLPAVLRLHDQDEVGIPNEAGGKRLGSMLGEINAVFLRDHHGDVGGGVPGKGDEPGGTDLNFENGAIFEELPKEPFRHGAPTDVTGADKEKISNRGDGTAHRFT